MLSRNQNLKPRRQKDTPYLTFIIITLVLAGLIALCIYRYPAVNEYYRQSCEVVGGDCTEFYR